MDARPTPEARCFPFRRISHTSGNAFPAGIFQACCPHAGPRRSLSHLQPASFILTFKGQANEQIKHRHSHRPRSIRPVLDIKFPDEQHLPGLLNAITVESRAMPSRWRWRALARSATTLCAASPCPAPAANARREPWIMQAAPSHGARGRSMPGPHLQSAGETLWTIFRAGSSGALAPSAASRPLVTSRNPPPEFGNRHQVDGPRPHPTWGMQDRQPGRRRGRGKEPCDHGTDPATLPRSTAAFR